LLIHVFPEILITTSVFVKGATHAIVERENLAIVVGEIHANVVGVIPAIAEMEIPAIVDGEMIASAVLLILAMQLAQPRMTHVMKIVRALTHVTQTVRVTIHVSIQIAPTTMSAFALVVL
jgi:hypothetical protein